MLKTPPCLPTIRVTKVEVRPPSARRSVYKVGSYFVPKWPEYWPECFRIIQNSWFRNIRNASEDLEYNTANFCFVVENGENSPRSRVE